MHDGFEAITGKLAFELMQIRQIGPIRRIIEHQAHRSVGLQADERRQNVFDTLAANWTGRNEEHKIFLSPSSRRTKLLPSRGRESKSLDVRGKRNEAQRPFVESGLHCPAPIC